MVADVMRLLIDILLDEEIIGEDVVIRESSAEAKGRGVGGRSSRRSRFKVQTKRRPPFWPLSSSRRYPEKLEKGRILPKNP